MHCVNVRTENEGELSLPRKTCRQYVVPEAMNETYDVDTEEYE